MSPANEPSRSTPHVDYRRLVVLMITLALLGGSALIYWFGTDSSATFLSAAMARIGLVLGALWLAWDSLRRPARWLPPGIAVLGVLGLAVMAAQPRLVLVVVPALGLLATITMVMRSASR